MKRRDRVILIVAFFALLFTFYGSRVDLFKGGNNPSGSSGIVKEVIDGDTAKIEIKGEIKDVRFLGIDTPELGEEDNPQEYRNITNETCLKKWAEKAENYTRKNLGGRRVELVYDPEAGKEGYYGRTLAYIGVNGSDFTKELLEKGYARVYDESDFEREINYLEAEKNAYKNREGLWECAG